MILNTPRLRLETLEAQHAQALLDYERRNREHLRRWEPARAEAYYSLENIRKQLEADAESMRERRLMRFAAFWDSPEIVSVVNLWQIRFGVDHSAVIGYSVDAACQSRGVATEAAAAVIRYAFEELNLHRLHTSYQPENHRSARVLEKLGFHVEGRAREQMFFDGAWRDGILVAILNPNWRAD